MQLGKLIGTLTYSHVRTVNEHIRYLYQTSHYNLSFTKMGGEVVNVGAIALYAVDCIATHLIVYDVAGVELANIAIKDDSFETYVNIRLT